MADSARRPSRRAFLTTSATHQDVRVENGVQFGDPIEFVDFDFLGRAARVNAAALWSLANAPGTPKNVSSTPRS